MFSVFFFKKQITKASWRQEPYQWAGRNSLLEKGILQLSARLSFPESGYCWARRREREQACGSPRSSVSGGLSLTAGRDRASSTSALCLYPS